MFKLIPKYPKISQNTSGMEPFRTLKKNTAVSRNRDRETKCSWYPLHLKDPPQPSQFQEIHSAAELITVPLV
jgi:hypothetical protein